tara:strand:+ start:12471 stop:12884 length:414 start_codon:yes stop_codon:yes gene_type:complete
MVASSIINQRHYDTVRKFVTIYGRYIEPEASHYFDEFELKLYPIHPEVEEPCITFHYTSSCWGCPESLELTSWHWAGKDIEEITECDLPSYYETMSYLTMGSIPDTKQIPTKVKEKFIYAAQHLFEPEDTGLTKRAA